MDGIGRASGPGKGLPKIQLARNVPLAEALNLLAQAKCLAHDKPSITALGLDPHDAANYNNRGVALAALGQADAARQDFIRALALDPSLAIARRNLQAVEAR